MCSEWSVGIDVISSAVDNGWQVSKIKIEHRTWKLLPFLLARPRCRSFSCTTFSPPSYVVDFNGPSRASFSCWTLVALGKPITMMRPRSNSAAQCAKILYDKTILPGLASTFNIIGPWLTLPVLSSNTAVLCMLGYRWTITLSIYSLSNVLSIDPRGRTA